MRTICKGDGGLHDFRLVGGQVFVCHNGGEIHVGPLWGRAPGMPALDFDAELAYALEQQDA